MKFTRNILILTFILLISNIVYSEPLVNPFNVVTQYGTNTTRDDLLCNFTITNSTKAIYNWYENNKTISVLNMYFEGGLNNSRKDLSDEFINFTCGSPTLCPYWNATGGQDGSGAYQYNDTIGQSLWSNMTINQKNLTTYTMLAWVKPNAFNFANKNNDFSRLIIAGENGVSYYQMATQRSTKMIYCRNQYNSTSADQTEYHLYTGNFTPNTWYHVACVLTPTETQIYVDGVLRNATTRLYPNLRVSATANSQMVLGNIVAVGGSRNLNGTLDSVKIYNRAMTSDQIVAEYNRQFVLKANNTLPNNEYKCSVYATTNESLSNETYSLNSVLMKTYYKTQVSLLYPVNTYHYMDYNGNVIFNVNATTNSNCVLNDTRFVKINNTHYFNATINQTEQKIYLSLNCSDYYDNTIVDFMFAIDNTIPFINIMSPTLDPTYTSNKYNFNFTFYAYDKFLDMMNFTASNGSIYYYVDETLTSYNNITKTYFVNLTEGYNNLEICIRDSLQNSPVIKDKMINFEVTSNLVVDSIADTKKNVKINYEYDKENAYLLFMDGVQILRSISQYDSKGKLKSGALSNFVNEWDVKGEHIKTKWDLNKDKKDDYTIIRYECLNGCNKLEVLTDRGRTRIVDDKRKMYFTFDDIEQMGYGVQLFTQDKVAYVKVYYKDLIQFNKAKSKETIDPITGGLMTNCRNKTIIVDSYVPLIVFNNDTFKNNYYTDGFDIYIDLSVTDNNFNSTTIYLYNETHHLIDTYTGFAQNIIITFTNLTYGVYYYNATTRDLAGNINYSETRKVTLLGNMDKFDLERYCVDNSLTNTLVNVPYCDVGDTCYFNIYHSNISNYANLSMIYTFDTTEYYNRNGLSSKSVGVTSPLEENVTIKLKTIWFNSTTMKCSNYYTSRMKIMPSYYVDVYLYRTDWMNKTRSYSGSFNYLYAIYTNKLDGLLVPSSSETLSSINTINAMLNKFNKKQLGIDMGYKTPVDNKIYFWGKYQFGKATLKLYEKGGHELYLINSNVYMNYSFPQFAKPVNYQSLNYDSLLIKGINLNESTDLGIIVGVEDTNPLELWSKVFKTIAIILLFLAIHGIVFFITNRIGIPQISMFLAFITIPITLGLLIITWVF